MVRETLSIFGMATQLQITVLGSGTSVGVPTIGCSCAVCRSDDPRDKRLRPSILVTFSDNGQDRNVLIDTTPDLRQQALNAGMKRLDAVLYTHAHADHIMGLDDLRPFNYGRPERIPIYGMPETLRDLRRIFRLKEKAGTRAVSPASRPTSSTVMISTCSGCGSSRFRSSTVR